MGIDFLFKMVGVGRVQSALHDLAKPPLDEGIKRVTLFLGREIKVATPVGTPESTGKRGYIGGRLRASIITEVYADFGRVGTNVFYAPFVEWGTAKMEARHVEGSAIRVLGLGMFGYGMKRLQAEIKTVLRGITEAIRVRWNS